MATEPRPYDINDPEELKRLIRELAGYLAPGMECRPAFLKAGTDQPGRYYAVEALDAYRWQHVRELKAAGGEKPKAG